MNRPELPTSHRSRAICGMVILAAATVAAYWPSLHGRFIWDDETLIANNEVVHAPEGWYRMWIPGENIDYWPVTNDSFWIEWHLWGLTTTGYHLDNLVLHIANSLLIWLILQRLSIPGAFLAALLFAVHPMNVESVAWIAQRKNTLSMLFFLLSIWGWLKCRSAPLRVAAKRSDVTLPPLHALTRSSLLWYCLSLIAFVAAMLSKGSVAFLPLVLLLIAWWTSRRISKHDLLRTAPFFLVAVALVGVNIWSQQHGGMEPIRSVTFSQRLAGAGAVVWFYLAKAFMPVNLSFIYPQWDIQTGNLLWWLPLLATAAVTFVLIWQRHRPWCRAMLFAWVYFCVALLPVMGFTDVYYMKYSLVADHYAYYALIGVVAIVAAGWSAVHRSKSEAIHYGAIVCGTMVAGALLLMARSQNDLYRDPVALYEHTLELNPNSWIVQNDLAKVLNDSDQPAEAQKHLEAAVRLSPNHVEIHLNLAAAAMKLGQPEKAIGHYQDGIRIDPKYPEAYFGLGVALELAGNLPAAIEQYRQAVKLEPDYTNAHFALAVALSNSGQPNAAIPEFENVVQSHPDFAPGHYQLGIACLQAGRTERSIEQFQEALKLNENSASAHNSLGAALQSTGQHDEAAEEFSRATQLEPENANAWGNLAAALDQLQKPQQALAAARTALKLSRQQGKVELTKEIEAWLQTHQSDPSASRNPPDFPITPTSPSR